MIEFYAGDLPEECRGELTKQLEDCFKDFKEKLDDDLQQYEQYKHSNSRHFKIYPENNILDGYRGGDCSHIDKWSGKADVVYPVREKATPEFQFDAPLANQGGMQATTTDTAAAASAPVYQPDDDVEATAAAQSGTEAVDQPDDEEATDSALADGAPVGQGEEVWFDAEY